MRIFLSYASEDRDVAERVHLALISSGYETFFDRADLPPGDDFNTRIRAAIADSDALVFLISPQSVAQGSYALTELKFARAKWRHPKRRVLPVIVRATEWRSIPSYLTAVTVLEPEGDVAAEIVHALPGPRRSWRVPAVALAATGALATLVLVFPYAGWWGWNDAPPDTTIDVQPPSPTRAERPENARYPLSDLWCATGQEKNPILARAAQSSPLEFSVKDHALQRAGKDVAIAYTENLGALAKLRVIVAHFTAAPAGAAERVFDSRSFNASAHVLIAPDGTTKQLVLFDDASWHAGRGSWNGIDAINRYSVGITLENWGRLSRQDDGRWVTHSGSEVPEEQVVVVNGVGWQRYTDAQIRAFFDVACALRKAYPSIEALVGHDEISPGRKEDPGPAFPIDELRRRLFVGGSAAESERASG